MVSTNYPEVMTMGAPAHDRPNPQPILINILQIALRPHPFQTKIGNILDYISQPHLHLGTRAVFLLMDKATDSLTFKITDRTAPSEEIPCFNNPLGSCHCGQVVQTGIPQFFTKPPPIENHSPGEIPYPAHYSIPVKKDGLTLAILCVHAEPNHTPNKESKNLLEAIANIFAVIIESQERDQQLITLVNDLRGSVINLREEKKFSESIIQGLKNALIVSDLHGNIIKSNSAAVSILKSFTDKLDGENLSEIFDATVATELLRVLPAGSERFDREITVSNRAGDKKIISYSNVSREDATDKKVGVIISMADISELTYVRKEMEKMNRLSTVAEIASAVAHEVRNPLAGIKIMAQSIEEEAGANSEQLECSQRIIRQVDRLNILLNDFFSYARPAEANKRPIALSVILAEIKPLIKNKLSKNHITLQEEISPSLPLIVADPNQVQQVFLNLFLNATDTICQRGIIRISAKLMEKEALLPFKKDHPGLLADVPYVVVDFADNGAGMAPHVADQVFEPFFTTKTSGAGLGLSIVYRTIKENDAEIVLKSEEGRGTTFTIFFRVVL